MATEIVKSAVTSGGIPLVAKVVKKNDIQNCNRCKWHKTRAISNNIPQVSGFAKDNNNNDKPSPVSYK